jgi:hypothetical protein
VRRSEGERVRGKRHRAEGMAHSVKDWDSIKEEKKIRRLEVGMVNG